MMTGFRPWPSHLPCLPPRRWQRTSRARGLHHLLTVQANAAAWSRNYYNCEGDAPGDQWRADFDQEGPSFLSRIDREAQWVESYQIDPPIKETLDPGPKDPASFTELLATGMDTYDFDLTRSEGGKVPVTGFDRLTGKTVIIDGITAARDRVRLHRDRRESGEQLRRSRGNEFIPEDWRMFFSGPVEIELDDGQWLPLERAR